MRISNYEAKYFENALAVRKLISFKSASGQSAGLQSCNFGLGRWRCAWKTDRLDGLLACGKGAFNLDMAATIRQDRTKLIKLPAPDCFLIFVAHGISRTGRLV